MSGGCAVTLETDLLLDRRRLKRRLVLWRVVAVLALVAAVAAVLPWRGAAGGRRVARLDVSGIITDDRAMVERVQDLARDRGVAALIVEVDSPGGSVAGGEALHDAIARVAAAKPVVTVMRGTAASAGYMISVPAARIFARASTLTGSIGVILETGEVSGLLAKLGVSATQLVSGPLKGQPSFTEPLSPAGRTVLQGLVGDLYEQFVAIVAEGRHMEPAKVRGLADGRAYTGRQALALGLVDEIGGDREARAWLAAQRQVPEALPVRDVRAPRGLMARSLGGLFGGVAKSLMLQGLTLDGAWALWQPAVSG